MIWYHHPWNSAKNLGVYLNAVMARIDVGDWACFTDADTMFVGDFYGSQIEAIIAANPKYDLFYAVTNRIGCPWQLAPGVDRKSDDIAYHRSVGARLKAAHGTGIVDVTGQPHGGSGFFILLSKMAWLKAGPFLDRAILGVDWAFFEAAKKAGVRIAVCPGLYMYHWYRGGDQADISHLI